MTSLKNPWSDLRELPTDSWLLFAAVLINRMGTMVVPFLVLYVTKELKASMTEASAVLLVYAAGSLITAPLSGRLSDRLGPPFVMKLSLSASGGLLLLMSWARDLWLFAILAFFTAIASEAFRPASMVFAGSVAPEKKRQAFALNRLAINLGMSIGPALGGVLAYYHFPAIFWVDGLTAMAAALWMIFTKLGLQAAAPALQSRAPQTPIWRALQDRLLLFTLLAIFPVIFAFMQHNGPVPIFMVNGLGLTEADYGLSITVNTVLIVLFEVPLTSLLAAWPNRLLLSVGALLVGLGIGGFALVSGFWGCVGAVIFWTFGEMLLFPAMSAHISEIAPKEKQGEYMGYYSMVFALAFLLGPPVGVLLYSYLPPALLWLSMLSMSLISGLLFWASPQSKKEGHQ
jgi:MFS family permease